MSSSKRELRTVALAGSGCGHTDLTCWRGGCCNTLRTPAMSGVRGKKGKGMHLVWVDEQYQLCAGLDPELQQLANTWPQQEDGSQWCLDDGVYRGLRSKGCLAGRGRAAGCLQTSASPSCPAGPSPFGEPARLATDAFVQHWGLGPRAILYLNPPARVEALHILR
ncbi:hypothetical protein PLESTF_001824500 [Pleodorina starrii]|nr:hypothetical protein PLESTF_000585800 [Pleodorina starrii]GLC71794.1 hypothetical protein PLESTF_001167700 [Pleodorina starrii]GLC76732.1 hypothetical protein PLESTF_001824500 [Pleodorina starrii]